MHRYQYWVSALRLRFEYSACKICPNTLKLIPVLQVCTLCHKSEYTAHFVQISVSFMRSQKKYSIKNILKFNWTQFRHFPSVLLPAVQTFIAVCWVILIGHYIHTVIDCAATFYFKVSSFQWFVIKGISKYLQDCTKFCEIMNVAIL